MSREKREALKGRKVIMWNRVSTVGQEGTLEEQEKANLEMLRALGFKGKPSVYSEQGSGTDLHLEQRDLAIKEAMASKKPVVMVMRDIQRFTRSPYHLGVLYNPMFEKEIPIISLLEPLVLGTAKVPNPASDLLAPILVAAGGSEVSLRKQQTRKGMKESRKKGVTGGGNLELHANEMLSPFRELGRLVGVNATEAGRRLGKSKGWVDRQRAKQAKMTPHLLEKWLTSIDLLRVMERKHGNGIGKRATVRMRAVRRMTGGFLFNPAEFPAVTQEMIDEYYTNFHAYKPRKQQR